MAGKLSDHAQRPRWKKRNLISNIRLQYFTSGAPLRRGGFTSATGYIIVENMKICDVLQKKTILADLKAQNKKGILEELVAPVSEIANVNQEDLVRVLMERERLGSTGIGGGIGIPHGKMKGIDSLILGFGLSRKGVDFESLDGQPTHIFFLLITPENSTGLHLKMLGRISRILKDDPFKTRLLNATNGDEILDIINEEDEDF
jgi:PTS system nitrogen regulatory IIA component